MTRKLILVCLFLQLFSIVAKSQQASPVPSRDTQAPGKSIDQDSAFSRVEVEASFAGGAQAWRAYLMKNLDASVPVRKKAPAGTYMVIVRFIVARDGTISAIEAETNHGYGMEKEVMRIIKKGPKWQPAMQDGKPLNAYRRQPVTFMVSEK